MAAENLSKPAVKTAITSKEAELRQRVEINKERVVAELMAAIEIAKARLDAGAMIRGWCEIAKMLGLYAPETMKMNIDVGAGYFGRAQMARYETMSDAELMAIIETSVSA